MVVKGDAHLNSISEFSAVLAENKPKMGFYRFFVGINIALMMPKVKGIFCHNFFMFKV